MMGHRAYSAHRAAQNFRKFDEAAMKNLVRHRHDQKAYIINARREIEIQEQCLQNDLNRSTNDGDHAWDSEFMRETINKAGS
jgi:CPA2 family monovalent cation:H+ antiporter-2